MIGYAVLGGIIVVFAYIAVLGWINSHHTARRLVRLDIKLAEHLQGHVHFNTPPTYNVEQPTLYGEEIYSEKYVGKE